MNDWDFPPELNLPYLFKHTIALSFKFTAFMISDHENSHSLSDFIKLLTFCIDHCYEELDDVFWLETDSSFKRREYLRSRSIMTTKILGPVTFFINWLALLIKTRLLSQTVSKFMKGAFLLSTTQYYQNWVKKTNQDSELSIFL